MRPGAGLYIYINMYTHTHIYPSPKLQVQETGHVSRFTHVHSFIACGRTWVPHAPAVKWSFTSIQMVHTDSPQQRGRWNDNESEMSMKMGWKLLSQDAKRGAQEKRERANTNTNTPGPERANPERARKEKPEADGNGTRPAEEGEDGSAWTNLPRWNLSLSQHAQDPTYLKRGKNTWNRGPMGD